MVEWNIVEISIGSNDPQTVITGETVILVDLFLMGTMNSMVMIAVMPQISWCQQHKEAKQQ